MIVCFAGLSLLGSDRPSYGGGLLPFTFDPDAPTFLGANGSLSYDASTGEFRGSALALTLSSPFLPGPGFDRFSGRPQVSFDLFVNPDGTFQKDGTGFDLTGTLSVGGTSVTGTLLSGDFTAFGAEPPGPPTWVANALFDTTGGLLTQPHPLADGTTLPTLFPTGGAPVGIDFFVENVTSGTPGDFTQSFISSKVKPEGGPISAPEPASGVLAPVGLIVLIVFGLIRKRPAPAS
jgi:hypothetical protein